MYDSSVKVAGSDEEDEVNAKHEMVVDDEKVMGWAKVSLTYSNFTNTTRWLCFLLIIAIMFYFRPIIMSLYKLSVATMPFLCHLVVVNLYSAPLNISNL